MTLDIKDLSPLTAKPKFLLQGAQDKAKCLRPHEVEQVPEATEKEDAPLVFAHAEAVDLVIDQQTFLLIETGAWCVTDAGEHGFNVVWRGRSFAILSGVRLSRP